MGLSAFRPAAVAGPDVEPYAGDRVDGIAEDVLAVFVEALVGLGGFEYFFGEIFFVIAFGYEAVRHEVGVFGDGTHIVPGVAVACAPAVEVFAVEEVVFDSLNQRRGLFGQGVAVGGVEKAVVGGVDGVGVFDLGVPLCFDKAVYVLPRREGTAVAVQRHVAVGNVVAKDEKAHGNVIACGGNGVASVFHAENLEAVDDAVGNGFAAVGTVASFNDEGLLIEVGFLP